MTALRRNRLVVGLLALPFALQQVSAFSFSPLSPQPAMSSTGSSSSSSSRTSSITSPPRAEAAGCPDGWAVGTLDGESEGSAVGLKLGKATAAAALCAAAMAFAVPTPALALSALEDAIVSTSEASYPIVQNLDAKKLSAWSTNIATALLKIPAASRDESVSLGLDMFNAVPAASVDSFNEVVKDAFSGLAPTADGCAAVPLPPAKLADEFVAGVKGSESGAAKLKDFDSKWGGTFKALPKSSDSVCLPPLDKYSKLALAQAQVGKVLVASSEGRQWGSFTFDVLKKNFPTAKILPLVKEGQELQYDTPYKTRAAFDKALTTLEKVAKAEVKAR